MDLTILGSAASEGWPALFCVCEACAEARRLGGKDLRRRTSYRLGEHIQIDWGPDTFAAYTQMRLDSSVLSDLVVTHTHGDHFTPRELFYRRPGFSVVAPEPPLTVHGAPPVEDALREHVPDDETFGVRFNRLVPYKACSLPDGVKVTPIPAAHAGEEVGALNFIFGLQDRCLLIANDTGWWAEEVWEFLAGFQFDVVVMDCTYGNRQERRGHLGAPDVVEARQQLLAQGSLREGCRYIANHFSHNGLLLYHQMEEFFGPHGIEVGYDGMVVEW